jgi:hypothetical protein
MFLIDQPAEMQMFLYVKACGLPIPALANTTFSEQKRGSFIKSAQCE